MTRKKQKHDEQEATQAQYENTQETPLNEREEGKDKNPQIVIAELNARLAEINDKYLRLFSEFDNYRKRTIKEKSDLHKTAAEGVITSLLTIVDDMERALNSVPADKQDDLFFQGFRLIFNKFNGILTQKGLQEINASGQSFDTDLHEAISHFAVEDKEQKNKIIEVVQKGYKLNDKVIRYAKVVVGL